MGWHVRHGFELAARGVSYSGEGVSDAGWVALDAMGGVVLLVREGGCGEGGYGTGGELVVGEWGA